MTAPAAGDSVEGRAAAGWRRPQVASSGLQRYLQVLRERLPMVIATLALTLGVAILYLATAAKTYEADAELLITPLSNDEPALTGLPLLRESVDPTRDVETAAKVAAARDVAARVVAQLHLNKRPSDLLKDVTSEPVAQSNIVALTAKAHSAKEAAAIANGFANAVVQERSAQLRRAIDERLPGLQRRAQSETANPSDPASPSNQVAELQSLRQSGDPTVRVQTRAEVPDSPSAPRPVLTLAAGLVAGLVLGIGGAFAMHALDPRLRREEQLRELYSLPILARIPRERRAPTTVAGKRRFGFGPRRKRRRALAPGQLSPTTLEAFRTLRTMLAATARPGRSAERGGRSVLVTGPSPSEGKTTTAINLASSLALSGHRVILIEADFRRPTVGEALGVRPELGIGKVLLGNVPLERALIPTRPFGDSLRLLLVDRADDWLAEVLSLPAAGALLDEAERIADYVVIDSPPLTEVIDALPLAQSVDDVVLVCRLGSSNLAQLGRLGDLLDQHNITPSGFVVVGVGSSETSSYYVSSRRERSSDTLISLGEDGDRESEPDRERVGTSSES